MLFCAAFLWIYPYKVILSEAGFILNMGEKKEKKWKILQSEGERRFRTGEGNKSPSW